MISVSQKDKLVGICSINQLAMKIVILVVGFLMMFKGLVDTAGNNIIKIGTDYIFTYLTNCYICLIILS